MSHDSINPYEPPNAVMGGVRTHDANIVIDGDCLKVPREGVVLAPRCVKCNEPGADELVRRLYWHSPWLYVMVVFPGVLFYALVAMVVRKKAVVQVSLCERHKSLRRAGILIGWLGFFGSVVAVVVLPDGWPGARVLCVCAMLLSPLIGLFMARVLDARHIDDTHVWLRVGPEFLASHRR